MNEVLQEKNLTIEDPRLILIVGGLGLAINVIGLLLFGEVGHGHSHGGGDSEGHSHHSHGGDTSEGHSHGESSNSDKTKKKGHGVRKAE